MGAVTVLILHPPLPAGAGPLAGALDAARREVAARHLAGFRAAGAASVALVEEELAEPFGARLRRLAAAAGTPGLVVLGSGAMGLARPVDYRAFVTAAGSDLPGALTNNRYSADAVALAGAAVLRDLPDLPADNALPRWLEEVAGYRVHDLRRRPRLGLDLDSPADAVLAGAALPGAAAGSPFVARLAALRSVLADRRAELTVAGRTSSATLAALERRSACRVRALIEERGLRAASRLAQAPDAAVAARPPASTIGLLLDRDGPEKLGHLLGRLGDAAVVDTRVLLAHRLGADEAAWPPPEDRYASDLLLPDRIVDPWLQALTAAAADAPIPVILGGHTLVGPGLRLLTERVR
ncbi:MAG TPA: hypothetical protein VLM76_13710 [Patescibacteria group bacterium]|nr:hypothetical protein [Patescibacteria group bacterium]